VRDNDAFTDNSHNKTRQRPQVLGRTLRSARASSWRERADVHTSASASETSADFTAASTAVSHASDGEWFTSSRCGLAVPRAA